VPFTFTRLDIPDVLLIEPRVFPDDRGFFLESYKASAFVEIGITDRFVQDNHSLSTRGVLRGLHYQLPPHAQGKLVRVVEGAVWDVAVDIRQGSATFGRWVASKLSAENHRMLYIPPGFAHGFLTLSDRAQFVYKCTAEYDKNSEAGVRWDDRRLAIEWPQAPQTFVVSDKDAALPALCDAALFE
jgi:dTDP-4-dehydrorhamnose 3,5-epimerase